ncbi:MAG: histidine kinase [Actinomycetota bacterium]
MSSTPTVDPATSSAGPEVAPVEWAGLASAPGWLRSPRAVDALVALGAILISVVLLALDVGEGPSTPTAASYALVVLAGLILLVRRRWPVTVLIVVASIGVAISIQSGADAIVAAVVALYTVARAGPRRRHLPIAIGVAVVAAVAVASAGTDPFAAELLGELGLLLLPVAIGDGARSRHERLQARIEAEAESRVQAERLRIARDLHDVVAHGLSTIAVQSGVAAHLLDRDPEQAREALTIINQTGRSSLEELRSMVGVLRSTEQAPLRPTPSDPNDLAELLAGADAAGVTVKVTTDGSFPDDVSEACVVAVHRIIQEALTNVVRHGAGAAAHLGVEHRHDRVTVTVTNGPGPDPRSSSATTSPVAGSPTATSSIATPSAGASGLAASTGVGLIGMTERAESLGGSLRAGARTDGGFEVVAVVPYHVGPVNGSAR